ncbi:putative periplasmic or exported protein [Serratia proteamaculans]|uniref:DUF1996 domain-containing protein n=1 Tax=Serratia proteamaculans TaxID=28151 RepID=UPI0009F7DA24|nr:DUF1996 domain-containing protein [Serratia proteamaculans]SMB48497.1 putative periplasmic or exported protein [Serratia proteamaculans]
MRYFAYYSAIAVSLAAGLPLSAFAAQPSGPQADVQCRYSHTLADDAIIMPGKPGMSMWHDFFGSTKTDADSTSDSLLANPETTCNNLADYSAYWVPSLRLENGTVVRPAYQKTYYQANNVQQFPLQPFPHGLELLVGDHQGTKPTPGVVTYFCQGQGYSSAPFKNCTPYAPGKVQFNIALAFPNCWDGKNLKPNKMLKNAVYAVNDACPAAYPVKIPTINMNVAYEMNRDTPVDLSKAQLSLDPVMESGKLVEKWGSIYTAHGDFMNGWADQAATFMTEQCMNNPMDCSTNVAYSYSAPVAEGTAAADGSQDEHSAELLVRNDKEDPGRHKMAYIKFALPEWPADKDIDTDKEMVYRLRTVAGNVTDTTAGMIYFYQCSNDWLVENLSWKSRPACSAGSETALYLDHIRQYRYINVDALVRQALRNQQTEITFAVDANDSGRAFSIDSAESKTPPLLMLTGYRK